MRAVVGRPAELAALDRLLDGAIEGPAGLVLAGPAGIGKTILWNAAAEAARERSFHVLSARPARAEAGLPLAAFGDLFSGAPASALARLPAPQRRALDVALLRAEPARSPADQRAVSVATTELLRALAAAGPLLLAIDDAHWLDDSSAAVLAFAIRRLSGSPVAVLLCWRGDAASPLGLDAALPAGRVETCQLGPLPDVAIRRILRDELGERFPRLAVAKIEEACGGNPFYALEIARALIRSHQPVLPGGPLPVPRTLAALTGERISALPPPARQALLTAALAAEPTLDVLRSAGVSDPAATLAPAVRDQIATVEQGAVRITHPLLASTVIALADPAHVRGRHAVLAVADTQDARALHLGLAAEGPDEAAAAALADAARRASLRGAGEVAAELMETARSLTPGPLVRERADRAVQAARWYFAAGDIERSSALLTELAAELGPGPVRARVCQLLGQISARSASFRGALTLALAAREDAGPAADLQAEIELDIAVDSLSLGDLAAAGSHAAAAVAIAETTCEAGLLAEALACQSIIGFLSGHALAARDMARALALEDPRRPAPIYARPQFVDALLRLFTGQVDDAVRALSAIWRDYADAGREIDAGLLSVYLTWALIWQGDLAKAGAVVGEARELCSMGADPVARAVSLTAGALLASHRCELERARAQGEEALALLRGTQWTAATIWPAWALGVAELSAGNLAAVDALLRPLAGMLTELPSAAPVLGVFLPDEIEALIGLGDLAEAEKLVDWLAAAARNSRPADPGRYGLAADGDLAEPGGTGAWPDAGSPWPDAVLWRARGALAAARGDLAEAAAALDHAVALHPESRLPFERARTLLAKGQVHRRRKEKRRAHDALLGALATFECLGSHLWADRARSELLRVGLRPQAPADLTETERLVAELAARGLTNREVAEAAFLSPKTVGNVLARVYRKLRIGSRAELGAKMAWQDRARPGRGTAQAGPAKAAAAVTPVGSGRGEAD